MGSIYTRPSLYGDNIGPFAILRMGPISKPNVSYAMSEKRWAYGIA